MKFILLLLYKKNDYFLLYFYSILIDFLLSKLQTPNCQECSHKRNWNVTHEPHCHQKAKIAIPSKINGLKVHSSEIVKRYKLENFFVTQPSQIILKNFSKSLKIHN